MIKTDKEVTEALQQIKADQESEHMYADEMIEELLISLGYIQTVVQIRKMKRHWWYA